MRSCLVVSGSLYLAILGGHGVLKFDREYLGIHHQLILFQTALNYVISAFNEGLFLMSLTWQNGHEGIFPHLYIQVSFELTKV